MSTENKAKARELVQFATSWGYVKCHDGESVWFPTFFGEGIAGKIAKRKTFVTLTFDAPIDLDALQSQLDEKNKEIETLKNQLEDLRD